MCVLICANPTVRSWLDAVTARTERDVFQSTAVCEARHECDERDTLPESVVQQIPRGQMLRECYWPRGSVVRRYSAISPETWKHPFDAVANAWCRLLVFVGLRR
jgi:hypothetical protein